MPFLTNFVGGLLMDEPDVPPFVPIDVQGEQQRAVRGNIQAFQGIRTLGSQTQDFLIDQIQRGEERLFPGIGEVRRLATERLGEGLRGELPRDTQDLIARRAAERGISTGTAGSQIADFSELQTLGLSSVARIDQSLNSALAWATQAQSRVPVFDPGGFFINPQFQAQFAQSERDRQFARDFTENQIEAAFSTSTILGQSIIQTGNEIMSLLETAVGSVGGASGAAA